LARNPEAPAFDFLDENVTRAVIAIAVERTFL
jgi:hypothetical protein